MLYRKMLRDLKLNKAQFLSIFIMAFLGIFVFAGLDSEGMGFQIGTEKYYTETNLADLWVSGMAFTESDVWAAESIEGIEDAEIRTVTDCVAVLEGEPDVQLLFVTQNDISSVKIVEGQPYEEGMSGVWLDYNFVEKQGLSVGDTITFKINQTVLTEIIRGTIYHPEYIYYLPDASAIMPEYGKYGFGIISGTEYPGDVPIVYTQMLLDVSEEMLTRTESIKEAVRMKLENDNIVITDRSHSLSYETFDNEIKQHTTMSFAFSAIFLIIAVLGIVTTMTRLTANQRIQIGTLKALGFSDFKIILHYVSYGFVLSLLGAITGGIAGYMYISDLLVEQMMETYLMPYGGKVFSIKAVVAMVISVAVSTFVSYFACRNELIYPPAQTLRPKAPKNTRHTVIEKSNFWFKLNFSTQWNLRDILRNKVRTFMGIIGVVGCTMLLVCALGCYDTMDEAMDWMYGELITCKYKIILDEKCTYNGAEEYAYEYSGQMVSEGAVELYGKNGSKTGTITVVDTGSYVHMQDVNQNSVVLEDGIALSYKMAQVLGVECGDMITWHIVGDDSEQTGRVTMIYRNPAVQGITMTRQYYESCGKQFVPTSILTNVTVNQDLSDEECVAGVLSLSDMKSSMQLMMDMMYLMIGILVIGAAILDVVVLYNMGSLSYVEKIREIATLKVLGFNTKAIRQILLKQNVWVTLAGIIIGMPLGKIFLDELFKTLGDSMDYPAIISVGAYGISAAATFLFSMAVNSVLSRKVKTVNMVDALKGVE